MDQIVCPNCGEPFGRVREFKELVKFCKTFWGQCSCGQKYHLILSTDDCMLLSFPERKMEIVC
jgi:hypothetical protein